jgi:hypothetical protein
LYCEVIQVEESEENHIYSIYIKKGISGHCLVSQFSFFGFSGDELTEDEEDAGQG